MPTKARIGLVAAVLLTSAVAIAGRTYPTSLSDAAVVHHSSGGGWLQGSLGAVRNSSDTVQYLGCWTRSNAGSEIGGCYVRDAAGTYGSCTTTHWRLLSTIRAMPDAARVRVDWDASYTCSEIQIWQASTEEPRD